MANEKSSELTMTEDEQQEIDESPNAPTISSEAL